MLRLEAGIFPLQKCGTYGKFGQSPVLSSFRMTRGAGYNVLPDDLGIGPAIHLPVTSNHASRSMLMTMLDGVLIHCHSLIHTLPLLQ